ncbi:MAG: DNA polymerase I [Spirochaetes bacterium]|nr:DNA polymerase I [Spirochaetota bacterium]
MKTLLLLDTSAILFRAYFAFGNNPLVNSKGDETSVLFGFFNTLQKLLQERPFDGIAAALDSRTKTFRHELDPHYKANRPETPPALIKQIGATARLLPKLGIPILQKDGFEADDFIATASREARRAGWRVEIFSGDKDLTQLVDAHVVMLGQEKKTGAFVTTGEAGVKEKWGVVPALIPDLFAIIGDSSDNVPGVKGIGPKGATKLIEEWGGLDAIYAKLDRVQPAGIREKLAASRENAFLSKKLVTLDADLGEIPPTESLVLGPVDQAAVLESLREWELGTIIRRFGLDREGGPFRLSELPAKAGASKRASKAEAPPEGPTALAFAPVGEAFTRRTLAAGELGVVADLARAEKKFVVDLETTSLDPYEARVVAAVFAFPGRRSFYTRLITWERNDFKRFAEVLGPILEDEGIQKIGHNLKFERSILARQGIALRGLGWDTMLAAWVNDSDRPTFNLEGLLADLFGVQKNTYKQMAGKAASILDIPEEVLETYTYEDGEYTWRLYEDQKAKLGERERDVLTRIELPLIPVLSDMELAGVELDRGALARQSAAMGEELGHLEAAIHGIAGMPFNIQSTKQLQEVLFERLKLPSGRKTKTGFSTDAEVLEDLAGEHEIARHLLRHRLLSKLKGTYLDALPDLVNKQTGRLHTDFNQTGAATGRLSSSNPNLQNIPIQGPDGRAVRTAFVAPEGRKLVSFDYSQVELRVLAHLSQDPRLLEAYRQKRDIHRETASFLFEKSGEAVTADERRIAKVINFSVIYGASAHSLSSQLGLTHKDAQRFIDGYFAAYAGVRAYIDGVVEFARKNRCVFTHFGRRRHIREIAVTAVHVRQRAERTAFNAVIQGTAADLMKQAMARIHGRIRAGGLAATLVLQVHDELVFYIDDALVEAAAPVIVDDMTRLPPFDGILEVDWKAGRSWDK